MQNEERKEEDLVVENQNDTSMCLSVPDEQHEQEMSFTFLAQDANTKMRENK